MIYALRIFFMIVFVAIYAEAFRMMGAQSGSSSLQMALKDYKEELAKTARAIASPGKIYLYLDLVAGFIKIVLQVRVFWLLTSQPRPLASVCSQLALRTLRRTARDTAACSSVPLTWATTSQVLSFTRRLSTKAATMARRLSKCLIRTVSSLVSRSILVFNPFLELILSRPGTSFTFQSSECNFLCFLMIGALVLMA